jgi:hypothetical protein
LQSKPLSIKIWCHDGLKARRTLKPQNRRALFHVELYLTVHKSFFSISLNIIHRGCTFHLSYPYWTITSLYKNTMSSITVTVHKININLNKNIIQWLLFSSQTIISYYAETNCEFTLTFFTWLHWYEPHELTIFPPLVQLICGHKDIQDLRINVTEFHNFLGDMSATNRVCSAIECFSSESEIRDLR